MELRQLRYFVAVAEEESFTRAARRLHVAQPGISAQVRKLEDELGEQLLDRSGRSVRLTAAGAEALPHTRAALAAAEAARSAVTELAGLTHGRVRVGTVPSCPVVELPDHLASFHRRFPGIDVSLSEANGDDLVKAIEEADIDVAVVGAAGEPNPRLCRVELTDEPLFAAVRRDHSLAGRATISLRALQAETLICLPPGTGMRRGLELACARVGAELHVGFEAGSPAMLSRLARLGLGVAILPQSVAQSESDLHPIRISGAEPRARIELVWRAEGVPSPAARALIEHLSEVLVDRDGDVDGRG